MKGEADLERVKCNLCGSWEADLLYPATLDESSLANDMEHFRCTSASYGQHGDIVRCRRCGLVYANPRRKEELIVKSYGEVVDQTYLEERQGRLLTFKKNLRPLERLMPTSNELRLLDVGCYAGIFLEVAEEAGWEVWGVEPCHWAAEKAWQRGLRVEACTLREAEFPAGFFDVVTMWDVIEHFSDPLRELKEIHHLLKRGGFVSVHTIDIESLLAKLMGANWPWLMEMHLYYFSPETLSAMLKKAGFAPIRKMTQGRFLRLNYLISRLAPYGQRLAGGLGRLARSLGLGRVPVYVNFGDLFTLFARKV